MTTDGGPRSSLAHARAGGVHEPCPCCACLAVCTCGRGHTGPWTDDGSDRPTPPPPTATPYLVIPSRAGDVGDRPLPPAQALDSDAIAWTVVNPDAPGGWADYRLRLSCRVANLGPVASPAAMIEFFTGPALSATDPGHATLSPAEVKADVQLRGRASFTAPPGTFTTVTSPQLWAPGSLDDARQGILVQVQDLFTDPWTAPFDAIDDRHVARKDDSVPRVWSTGVDVNARPLAAGPDPHWDVVAGTGITSPRPAVVLTDQDVGGAYFRTTDSAWVWGQPTAGPVGWLVHPGHTFRLLVDVTGFDPGSVRLAGSWGVDNDGTMTFNGQPPTGTGTHVLTGSATSSFNVPHAFDITGGFVAGVNTLEIQVVNTGGPAGLNVTGLTLTGTPA